MCVCVCVYVCVCGWVVRDVAGGGGSKFNAAKHTVNCVCSYVAGIITVSCQ